LSFCGIDAGCDCFEDNVDDVIGLVGGGAVAATGVAEVVGVCLEEVVS
jgi:hypothetical protein